MRNKSNNTCCVVNCNDTYKNTTLHIKKRPKSVGLNQ